MDTHLGQLNDERNDACHVGSYEHHGRKQEQHKSPVHFSATLLVN